jgi:nucleoside-diphosphate-sugar epimerase
MTLAFRESIDQKRSNIMEVLVTGGGGYIGSVLVPMLLSEGHQVTVIDSFMYGQSSLMDCCHHESLSIIRGDVRNEALIRAHLKKADAILPLACLTGAPLCDQDPVAAQQVNFDAVRLIAEEKSRDQRLIFPCTNSGYGVGQEGIHCDEETLMKPVSLYGRLKVDIDRLLLDSGHCITFRFATAFGVSPRMRLDLLVNDFTYRAVVDRTVVLFEADFKRNYLHVRDASRAFLHALSQYDSMVGEPYNVGLSEANLSKKELCQVIKTQVPDFTYLVSEIGKDPDQRNYIVSNAKIEATGYRTEVDLNSGIRELVKGFQVIRRTQYSNI